MPFEFMRITGVPADMPSGGACICKFDGLLVDYVAHVKERRGQSTARLKIDTPGTIFDERRYESGATSGFSRGMYLRLYLTGATGAWGEALRVFTDVENVRGLTAQGAHISLKFGTTGSISGLGCALRATLHIPSRTLEAGGDYTAIQAEIYADGGSSDAGAVTHLSFIRAALDGTTAGRDNMEDDVHLFNIEGGSINSGHLVETATAESEYAYNIRIIAHGQVMYLMCASART